MRTHLKSALLSLALFSAAQAASAGEWQFLPVQGSGYKADVVLSLAGGTMEPNGTGSAGYVGAELAFNCLLLAPPTGTIRTKLSYGSFDHTGIKLSTLELNPRWMVNVTPALSLGAGPGLGMVSTEVAGKTKHLTAAQIGADLDYRMDHVNLGLTLRRQATRSADIGGGLSRASNTLLEAKVGYAF